MPEPTPTPATDGDDPPRLGPFRRALALVRRATARLLDHLHRWAESGWSGPAVLAFNTMQSSFFPAPADTLLVPLGLADPPRVWRLVAWATVGATLGGSALFAVGAIAFDRVGPTLLGLLRISPADWSAVRAMSDDWGALFVAASAFLPVSTKLSCLAAGAFAAPVIPTIAALAAARLARFSLVAVAIQFGGTRLRRWVGLDPPPARPDHPVPPAIPPLDAPPEPP